MRKSSQTIIVIIAYLFPGNNAGILTLFNNIDFFQEYL
jgi:hypothetical protein